MRNTICLLLLTACFGYAQDVASIENGKTFTYKSSPATVTEEQLLKKEDFKLSDGRMSVNSITCKIQNYGNTNTILVSVVCQQQAFNQLGVDKINDMILVVNEKVRNSVQVEHQYNPTEIKMAYIPDSQDWSLTSSFTVQDEDGVVIERHLAIDFDVNGKFEVMKRIL